MKVKDNAPLILKKNNYHPRHLYPDKSFQFKAKINRQKEPICLLSTFLLRKLLEDILC